LNPRPSGRRPNRALALFLVVFLALGSAACAGSSSRGSSDGGEGTWQPVVGPPRGALVVAGGGRLGPEIWERFVELAGGDTARIVVIPTAAADEEFDGDWPGLHPLRDAGVQDLRILHTRDREEAQSPLFAQPLARATGVWIPGGRQWRLVDAYLNTRIHEELFALLDRGGVIGGTSAGASIQASYLVRGDPSSNQVVMGPGYEEGFGFLAGTAVDQHLLARGRENDLWEILDLHPDLLGIGLDEGTAIVVQGNRAEVLGKSEVLVYDPGSPVRGARSLRSGAIFDLGERSPMPVSSPDDSGRDPRL
jgi:cyanophycinase